MKKVHGKLIVVALLAILMVVFAAGCGGGGNDVDVVDDVDVDIEDVDDDIDFDFDEDEDEDEDDDAVVVDEGDLLSEAELREIYDSLSAAFDERSLEDMTYEQVRDEYFDGVEGVKDPVFTSMDSYEWFMAGGVDMGYGVSVRFNLDEGTVIGIGKSLPE